ncbi:hypothetical protein [Pseudohaliea sp.]|uniref:hypothetical protein n=1 Tax=Pseudohaliea sp. TaxID=2740289 RepID=UPI0032EAB265
MQRFLGTLLIIAGAGLGAWSLLVGGSFVGLLLMGFIGTGGREAGDQLAVMALLTVAGVGAGYGLLRLGRRLAPPRPK